MRQRLAVLSVSVLLACVAAPIASAEPVPARGCGAAFELMSLQQVLDTIAAEGFEDRLRAEDRNADTYLCVFILENFPFEFEEGKPVFVFTDNNAALRP